MRNTHPVVVEHTAPAFVLDAPMLTDITPRRDGRLAAPEPKPDQFAFLGYALKAFDRNKSVGCLNQWHERCCHIEVALPLASLRPGLEDYDDHSTSPNTQNRSVIQRERQSAPSE